MYDPTIGVWISEDPIGFEAADENLRRYVGNNPTLATDPSGLETQKFMAPRNDETKKEYTSVFLKETDTNGNSWEFFSPNKLIFVYINSKVTPLAAGGTKTAPNKPGGKEVPGIFWTLLDYKIGFNLNSNKNYDRIEVLKVIDELNVDQYPNFQVDHNGTRWGLWGLPPRGYNVFTGQYVGGGVEKHHTPFKTMRQGGPGFENYYSFPQWLHIGHDEHYVDTPESPNYRKHVYRVYGAYGICNGKRELISTVTIHLDFVPVRGTGWHDLTITMRPPSTDSVLLKKLLDNFYTNQKNEVGW